MSRVVATHIAFVLFAAASAFAQVRDGANGVFGDAGTTPCPAGLALTPTVTGGGTGLVANAQYTYQSQFCCQGSSYIIGWTMNTATFATGKFPGVYLAGFSAACSEEPDPPLVVEASSFSTVCPRSTSQSDILSNFSATGFQTFSTRSAVVNNGVESYSVLTGFSGGNSTSASGTFSCPTGQVAVGFAVTSQCYGLTNLQVICKAKSGTSVPPVPSSPPSRSPPAPASISSPTPPSPASPASSGSNITDSLAPIFAPLPTGGIRLAGTYSMSGGQQAVNLNGTYNFVLPANTSQLLPSFKNAKCGALGIQGSAGSVNAYLSQLVAIRPPVIFLNPDTQNYLADSVSNALGASQVDAEMPTSNFNLSGNFSTVTINNRGSAPATVSAAHTLQPKGACGESGSSGPTSVVSIKSDGFLVPAAILPSVYFTNATCLRTRFYINPSPGEARQSGAIFVVQEGPKVAAMAATAAFVQGVSISLNVSGTTSDLTNTSLEFIAVNNSLDPTRVYRVRAINSGAPTTTNATIGFSVTMLSQVGADCSVIASNLSVPGNTLSKLGAGPPAPVAQPPATPKASPSPVPSQPSPPPQPSSSPTPPAGGSSPPGGVNTDAICAVFKDC